MAGTRRVRCRIEHADLARVDDPLLGHLVVEVPLHRDHADVVMLGELASNGTLGAQISNESEIGGVGTVAAGLAAKDTDGDGMPDWWEEAAGTNRDRQPFLPTMLPGLVRPGLESV